MASSMQSMAGFIVGEGNLFQNQVMVRMDVGGTPLHTSLATVMEGARQGGVVFKRICEKVHRVPTGVPAC